MRNLDTEAAQAAQWIVRAVEVGNKPELENLTTKALGVLQENGVYAATLFLFSRPSREQPLAKIIWQGLSDLLPSLLPGVRVPQGEADQMLAFVAETVATDLDRLLLVKQVWEQTLIYVRYGAKARG